MNITPSQHDADFILKYIRVLLENVSDTQSEIGQKYNKLQKHFCEKLNNNEMANEIMSFAKEVTSEIDSAILETKNDLEKCVMLLTVGSEVFK